MRALKIEETMSIRQCDRTRRRASKLVLSVVACWHAVIPISVLAAEPLALRKIMSELGRNTQLIAGGLAREDYAVVENAARAIADHPQPPLLEKTRIIGFVGTSMVKYKAYDGKTHDAAMVLAAAAKSKAGQEAINAFQSLQTGCYDCHSEFRKPFVEHFYATR